MSKLISKADALSIAQDITSKADNRFAKGAGIIFSIDANGNLSATHNGDAISFPSGSTAGVPDAIVASIINGTY